MEYSLQSRIAITFYSSVVQSTVCRRWISRIFLSTRMARDNFTVARATVKTACRRHWFNDYLSSSTIHGIGYLGANDKSLPEKIWWIIVVILSVSCCFYLISRTWIKWKNNPVILSFEQEQTQIWKIPFPAVTICPVNKVLQMEYNYTEMFRKRDELVGEDLKEFWDISLICNLEQYETSFNCSINITDENAITNILSAAPSISDTLEIISWQSKQYSVYEKLFAEQLTEEGLCFTFNSFSQNDMYTTEMNHDITYINHNVDNAGWKLEEGYPHDATTVLNDHPRRTAKDGSGSGLSIKMFHFNNNTDYVCGPSMSGYKIILHNPAETPRPTQQYFLVPLNKQAVLTVKPELTTTSENLRFMAPSVRKCYFSNEKSLRFFKVYTQSNCRVECTVNVTQHICGCVPFYVPHSKGTPICGFGKLDCLLNAEGSILDYEMIQNGINATSEVKETEAYKIFDSCNCQPSCSNLQFSAETSQSDIHVIASVIASGLAEHLYADVLYQLQNGILACTQVDIFFKESQFLALHRSELYGQTDFLANCGGLLGLFMGFSLLSLIEIFYFSTIRLWIKWRNRKNLSL